MRIAQVSPLAESVPPKLYGGTERIVSYLTEELVAMGHEVTLYASGDSITSAHLVPMMNRALRLDPEIMDVVSPHYVMLEHLFREAEQNRFDVVHFHTSPLHFPFCRRHRKVVHVTTLHGRLDTKETLALHQEYRDIPVVSISEAQRRPILEARWQGTVHHGIPLGLYPLQNDPADYLAFLGRISPEKGLDRAIEIARRSKMKLKVAAKVDSADGEYFQSKIRQMLDDSGIEFVGEINDRQKIEFLGKAKALLFPIDWPEPFGLVMIESMACGTPVIAFNHGSVPEIVSPGVSGYIVNGIPEAVAAVESVEAFNRKACRQYFEQNFSARRMAENYLSIYETILNERRAEKIIFLENWGN